MKRRKDGRFMKWFTVNGKRKPIYGYSPEEVEEKIDQIKFEQRMGLVVDDTTTMREWASLWFKTSKEGKLSHSAENAYRNVINVHIIPYFEEATLREIKPVHVQAFMNTKSDKSTSLTRKILVTLRQIFKSAIANGIILTNPAETVELTGVETKEKTPLTDGEQKTLLAFTEGTRVEIFINLALFCGLRRGEILALKWEDIDLAKGVATVNKSVAFIGNRPHVKTPKTKAGKRVVPIPARVIRLLAEVEKKEGYVVTDTRGRLMSEQAYVRFWEIVINKLQKPFVIIEGQELTSKEKRENMLFQVTPHKLRHTYCTSLYKAGIDLKTAQSIMGHAKISTTAEIYTHLENSHITSARNKIDAFFS